MLHVPGWSGWRDSNPRLDIRGSGVVRGGLFPGEMQITHHAGLRRMFLHGLTLEASSIPVLHRVFH